MEIVQYDITNVSSADCRIPITLLAQMHASYAIYFVCMVVVMRALRGQRLKYLKTITANNKHRTPSWSRGVLGLILALS